MFENHASAPNWFRHQPWIGPVNPTTETVTISNTAEAAAADLTWAAAVTGGALPGDCADGQTLDVTGSGFVASAQAGIREFGQSFTVPCDGILTSISLQTISTLGSGTQPWTGTLRLYQGEGTAGPQIASAPGAGSNPDETPVPFTATFATPASVVARQVYTWFWDLDTGESGLVELINIYPGGSAYSTANTGDPAQAGPATTEDFPFSATFALGAPSWVTVAPSSGSIAPGTSVPLGVTFDATGLTDGI